MTAGREGPGASEHAVLAAVAKATGLLAVAGYVSLRAHLNRLGISGPAFLGPERYLMETYFLAVGLFEVVLWTLPAVGVLAALRRLASGRRTPRRGQLVVDAVVAAAPWAFLLLLLGVLLMVSVEADAIVGNLRDRRPVAGRPFLFRVTVLGAACWALLLTAFGNRGRHLVPLFGSALPGPIARFAVAAITAGYALTVPLVYGIEGHPSTYPVARVALTQASEAPLCGIVVLHWNDGLILWRMRDGKGWLTSVAKDKVEKVEWGPMADVLVARLAAPLPGELPDCTGELPPLK